MKFESPEYVAVKECEPATSEEVENVAWPAELIGTVVRVVEPSLKAMLPVGVPAPGATTLTVAVSVTDPFRMDGLAEELNVVVVEAGLTVSVSVPILD